MNKLFFLFFLLIGAPLCFAAPTCHQILTSLKRHEDPMYRLANELLAPVLERSFSRFSVEHLVYEDIHKRIYDELIKRVAQHFNELNPQQLERAQTIIRDSLNRSALTILRSEEFLPASARGLFTFSDEHREAFIQIDSIAHETPSYMIAFYHEFIHLIDHVRGLDNITNFANQRERILFIERRAFAAQYDLIKAAMTAEDIVLYHSIPTSLLIRRYETYLAENNMQLLPNTPMREIYQFISDLETQIQLKIYALQNGGSIDLGIFQDS